MFRANCCRSNSCIFKYKNHLLGNEQHGFREKRSTVSNLLTCDAIIADSLNRGEPCDGILPDFARAFDKVSHNILEHKLSKLGNIDQPLMWIKDFLCNLHQRVVCKGSVSTPMLIGYKHTMLLF